MEDQSWIHRNGAPRLVARERCAIQRYEEVAEFTNGKDHSTYQIAVSILNEELEHEHDIEDFLIDIERLKEDIRKFRL